MAEKEIIVPWADMRRLPKQSAEMVSGVLLGEKIKILKIKDDWANIESLHDGYSGYISNHFIGDLSTNKIGRYWAIEPVFQWNDMYISTGSLIKGGQDCCSDKDWLHSMLGVPYVWGGRSGFGIDCSGLSQLYWLKKGLNLPRDAWQQEQLIEKTIWSKTQENNRPHLDDVSNGSLLFFKSPQDAKVTHVAIKHGKEIVHASRRSGIVLREKLELNNNLSISLFSIKKT